MQKIFVLYEVLKQIDVNSLTFEEMPLLVPKSKILRFWGNSKIMTLEATYNWDGKNFESLLGFVEQEGKPGIRRKPRPYQKRNWKINFLKKLTGVKRYLILISPNLT